MVSDPPAPNPLPCPALPQPKPGRRSSSPTDACAQHCLGCWAAGLHAVRAGWLPDLDPSAWRAWIKGRPNFHPAKWLHEGTSCLDVSTSRTNSRIWVWNASVATALPRTVCGWRARAKGNFNLLKRQDRRACSAQTVQHFVFTMLVHARCGQRPTNPAFRKGSRTNSQRQGPAALMADSILETRWLVARCNPRVGSVDTHRSPLQTTPRPRDDWFGPNSESAADDSSQPTSCPDRIGRVVFASQECDPVPSASAMRHPRSHGWRPPQCKLPAVETVAVPSIGCLPGRAGFRMLAGL